MPNIIQFFFLFFFFHELTSNTIRLESIVSKPLTGPALIIISWWSDGRTITATTVRREEFLRDYYNTLGRVSTNGRRRPIPLRLASAAAG